MNRRHLFAATAGMASLALPFASSALSQTTRDRLVVTALMGGDFALASSKMALQRSQNPNIRNFAQLEISEQEAVARAFGARPGSAGLRQDHAAMLEQLRTLSGPGFDQQYLVGQRQGHQELLQIHRSIAGGGDPVTRAASTVAVPAIRTHIGILNTLGSTLSG